MIVLILVLTLNMALTDFWWLTSEQANKYVYVELVHHQDFNNPYFAGIQSISEWRNKYQNANLHRSLKIWADNSKSEALSGPFVIDIDNTCGKLDDALIVTRNAVEFIINLYNLKESDIRSFFTGHKGFNLEIIPSAVDIIGTPEEQERRKGCIRGKIIKALQKGKNIVGRWSVGIENGRAVFRDLNTGRYLSRYDLAGRGAPNSVSAEGTIIDTIKDYTRLHNSINEWIECGATKARRKIALTLGELNSLPLEQIVAESIA